MQKTAIRLTRRSAVRNFESSALRPDPRILWKTSIFHLNALPFDLLDSVLARLDREIGEKLPLDLLSPLRPSRSSAMDHGQSECGIFLLLADRRQNSKLAETNFEKRFIRIAFVVLDLDPM